MGASKMLDLLHYYMEDDYLADSREQATQKTRVRKVMYREFYDRDYTYGVTDEPQGRQYLDPEDLEDNLNDVTPVNPTAKPYTPPTDFNPESPDPFGGVLDTPLG